MSVTLNKSAFEYAKGLIKDHFVFDDMDQWSEHQPTTEAENEFIEVHGISEYAKWHLGIDPEQKEDTKGRYKFPYGDFNKAHRCGVIAAEVRAGQYKYTEIETAAAHLHGMIEAANREKSSRSTR